MRVETTAAIKRANVRVGTSSDIPKGMYISEK